MLITHHIENSIPTSVYTRWFVAFYNLCWDKAYTIEDCDDATSFPRAPNIPRTSNELKLFAILYKECLKHQPPGFIPLQSIKEKQ